MNISTLTLVIMKQDEPLVRAKVRLLGSGIDVETTTSNKGLAMFNAKGWGGKKVDILVNGQPIKQGMEIPKDHPNGAPKATIVIGGAPAGHDAHAPAGHDAHAPAGHDAHAPAEEEEDEGHVFIVEDEDGEPIDGAVIRVDKNEVYTTKDGGEAIVPYFTEMTRVEVSAPGYQAKTVRVRPEANEVTVELEREVNVTSSVNWLKVMIFTLVIAVIGVIGYVASVMGPSAQSITFNPLANASGDPIAQSIMKFSTWAALIVVVVGRARLGQWWDVISAVVFLGVSFLAEWLSPLNALDPAFVAAMPQGVNQVIEFFRYFRWVIYIVAIAWMYWAAWNNTPDLSMPGAIWDVISLVVFTQGNRMGLPVSDTIGQIQLAMGLKVFAALHYLADMFQVPQMVMKKEVKPKLDPIFFGIMTLVLFVGAMAFMSPGIAAFASLLVAGLFTEMIEEVTKNYDPDRAPLQLGKMLQFMKTNKADGVLFAAFIINVLGWFGVWTFLVNKF